MSETGWPLIPRELLPAPVKRVRHPRSAPAESPVAGRQLSIFGAETTEPSPADLAGLLAGPGRLDRMGGTARVRVPVDAGWRVHVLMNELVRRGLVVSWHPLAEKGPAGPATGARSADVASVAVRANGRPKRPDHPETIDETGLVDVDVDWPGEPEQWDEPAGAAIGGGARLAAAAENEQRATPVGPAEHARPAPSAGRSPQDERSDAGAAGTGEFGPAADLTDGDESGETDDPDESWANAEPWHVPPPLFEVRTAYSRRLNAFARSWPEAADDLFLSGPRLRLWVAAAGYPAEDGFRLGLTADQDPATLEAALVRTGLGGSVADDGRSYLITGKRRLTRLAELVGERPPETPPGAWPGGARA